MNKLSLPPPSCTGGNDDVEVGLGGRSSREQTPWAIRCGPQVLEHDPELENSHAVDRAQLVARRFSRKFAGATITRSTNGKSGREPIQGTPQALVRMELVRHRGTANATGKQHRCNGEQPPAPIGCGHVNLQPSDDRASILRHPLGTRQSPTSAAVAVASGPMVFAGAVGEILRASSAGVGASRE